MNTPRFADHAGSRTYIASMQVAPDFAAASRAASRTERKIAAFDAQTAAEKATSRTLVPKLEALKKQGLVNSFNLVPLTGAMVIDVPEANAGAAFDALQGVSELGRIVRNRVVTLGGDVVTDSNPAPNAEPAWNVGKVKAPAAWKMGATGKGVVIGFVDTGVDAEHKALETRYRGYRAGDDAEHEYNFVDVVAGEQTPYDDNGHGTHVAGTGTGQAPNRLIGMAPDAKFIAAKVFTSGGSSDYETLLRGLSWMLAPTDANGEFPKPALAPDIVSNSWGTNDGGDLTFLPAFKAYEAAGIVPMVAAGNAGPMRKSIGSPGSYRQSITVAATDDADKIASFSSRGPNDITDDKGEIAKPDFAAPGVQVISAAPGGTYVAMSGTSMATPGAAGVAALLLSKYPNLSNEQVRKLMSDSADPGKAWFGKKNKFGAGRINAQAAIALAAQRFGGK